MDLDSAGYAVADIALDAHQCDHIASTLPAVGPGRSLGSLITHPTVVTLLLNGHFGTCMWSLVRRNLVAVKATLYDRAVESSWDAEWHQDRAIAVRERLDVPGYGPWSARAGNVYVDAPTGVLSQMLVVRVHLDACGIDNGPLRVVPGSHHSGKLTNAQITATVATALPVDLHLSRGAILVMRPLLVYSTLPAHAPEHRRILQIELAPAEAISPLRWPSALQLQRVRPPARRSAIAS